MRTAISCGLNTQHEFMFQGMRQLIAGEKHVGVLQQLAKNGKNYNALTSFQNTLTVTCESCFRGCDPPYLQCK